MYRGKLLRSYKYLPQWYTICRSWRIYHVVRVSDNLFGLLYIMLTYVIISK